MVSSEARGGAAATGRPAAERPTPFDVAGPPGASVIVFVHSTRLTRSMWTAQVAALAAEFRCVTLDLPGHGTQAAQPFTLDAAAAAVAGAIEAAGSGPAVIVGLSLGGYVAMDVAAGRPELVRGLVLSGASAEPVGWRSRPYLGLAWAMDRGRGPRLDALDRWFFRTRFPPVIAEPVIAGGFWYAGGAAALRAIAGQPFVPRLRAYPGPTLLVNGTYDVPFRLTARTFARAAREPRRVRLGGATHLANLDRPGAFNEAIRRFVRSLEEDAETRSGTGPV
jgi:pimeloyl-ACP methyl ester carboxylesterase